jgi:hypothetical protein
LATVKTTLVLDEKIWSEFRRFVEAAYGTTRKMSAGVEEALGSFTPVAVLDPSVQSVATLLRRFAGFRFFLVSR